MAKRTATKARVMMVKKKVKLIPSSGDGKQDRK